MHLLYNLTLTRKRSSYLEGYCKLKHTLGVTPLDSLILKQFPSYIGATAEPGVPGQE